MEKIRVAVVGAPKVGKSAVIHQFVSHIFIEDHEPTIEDMFQVQRNGIILEIMDLSGCLDGPEAKIRKEAVATSDAIVYMFAVDDPQSLYAIRSYRKEEKRNIPFLLVANKMDCPWRICPIQLRNVEYYLDTIYCPVSASQAANIDYLFDQIIEKTKNKTEEQATKDLDSSPCCDIL